MAEIQVKHGNESRAEDRGRPNCANAAADTRAIDLATASSTSFAPFGTRTPARRDHPGTSGDIDVRSVNRRNNNLVVIDESDDDAYVSPDP